MKGHLRNFNNNITRKPGCAEPIILQVYERSKRREKIRIVMRAHAHAHTHSEAALL